MKLFQQLLVAPAALGLMAPLAVVSSPAANAAELNINGVSDYAATASGNSLDQVTSVTQFSDVYPTDWAYQALANLVETYGCVACSSNSKPSWPSSRVALTASRPAWANWKHPSSPPPPS